MEIPRLDGQEKNKIVSQGEKYAEGTNFEFRKLDGEVTYFLLETVR